MSILDLQGMKGPKTMIAGKSGASKNCGNVDTGGNGGGKSSLSLTLC